MVLGTGGWHVATAKRQPGDAGDLRVDRVVETGVYVEDLAAAKGFYQRVLGLQLVSEEKGRHVFLKAGKSMLLLFRAERTLEEPKLPPHGAAGSQHFALQTPGDDYQGWKDRLVGSGVEIEQEVSWGTSRSLHFRDPDGNLVELITAGNWPVDP